MIIDYQGDKSTVSPLTHHAVDAETGEPIAAVFYADDEAGTCRAYLSMPDDPRSAPYLHHKATHEPLDHRVFAGDPDEHDWEVAWTEVRRPIRIVRRNAAGAA